ncbi:unnamed protein product [Amoebophrya sp. A25]|nr:unnamed protein product [Amoebophrya sp. A25]|eukprot:GSA25T00005362001.1
MGFSKLLFAGLPLLAQAQQRGTGAGEVIVGTKDNFDEILSANPGGALVEFYAPWCGHCKKLEPEYNKAATMLNDEDIKIPLVKVDATIESKLSGDHGVQGYPTLKWFVGGKPTEYDGPRDASGIVAWIKSMSGPAVVDGEPKDDDKLSVTWYGADKDTFEEIASANRKKASWYFVKGSTPKMVVKHVGEDAIELTPSTKDEIETAFTENAFPLYGALDGETFGAFMERGAGMIWNLMEMTKDNVKEVVDASRPMMTAVAKKLGTDFSVTWTNTEEFKKVLENMFGVTEFPKLIVQLKAGDKKNFIYDGEMTEEAILDYVSKAKSGEIQPHLKSEPAPEEPQEEPVKVVVGKNLEKLVFTEDKDVLLEVYAPWCGHCKKLEPEYNKVGKKVKKEGFEDIITIAKMDGTANDSPVDSISWSGFPTMYYIKAGEKTPMKYDGGRDAKGIWKWIKKNHSKADMIKEKLAAKAEKKEKKEEL